MTKASRVYTKTFFIGHWVKDSISFRCGLKFGLLNHQKIPFVVRVAGLLQLEPLMCSLCHVIPPQCHSFFSVSTFWRPAGLLIQSFSEVLGQSTDVWWAPNSTQCYCGRIGGLLAPGGRTQICGWDKASVCAFLILSRLVSDSENSQNMLHVSRVQTKQSVLEVILILLLDCFFFHSHSYFLGPPITKQRSQHHDLFLVEGTAEEVTWPSLYWGSTFVSSTLLIRMLI